MFDAICLGLALTVGQPPLGMKATPVPPRAERAADSDNKPFNIPIVVLAAAEAPASAPEGVWLATQKDGAPPADPKCPAPAEKKDTEEKKNGDEQKKNGEEEKKNGDEEEKKEEPKKGYFMQMVEGTELGCHLAQKGITVSGWFELGYACSDADGKSNLPVTWNERNRKLRTHQFWVRVQQPLDTESKCPSTGFLVDVFWGSDYRYTLQRGFLNSQLKNTRGGQNNHGFDMPQAYVNYYDPGLFEGTELRLGKFFTPFGYESIEAPTTPLFSRSYAFNWCPPFTHWGGMAIVNLDKNTQVTGAIVNGNDVMWFDPAEEYRILAKYQWTSDDKKTFWAVATSLGRGRFDPSEPFAPATFGTANEPAGRNNINVFDFVYSTAVSDELTLACEAIYGYQYNVPANVPGGIIDLSKAPGQPGTAHWGSVVGYAFYKFDEKVTGVLRGEMFYDAEGQRTGFEGLYCAGTVGLQIRPTDCLLIRPELRYDRNDYSRPFDGGRRHDLCTAAFDVILLY
jgi:hypothetical protein